MLVWAFLFDVSIDALTDIRITPVDAYHGCVSRTREVACVYVCEA